MRFWLQRGLVAGLGVVLLLQAPARAQEASGLAQLPAETPLVIQVHGIDRAKDRLGKMLSNAVPDLAPKVMQQINNGIQTLLFERDVKAIAKDKHLFVAFMELSGLAENPQVAVVIPVSSYKEFQDTFLKEDERKTIKKDADGFDTVQINGKDEPSCLIDRKDHIVVTADRETAKRVLKKDGGLHAALAEGTRTAFLGPDVAVYVNLKEVNAAFGAQLQGFKALIDLALQQGGGAPGLDKKQMEMFKNVLKGAFQILEDGVAAVIAFDFRPEGFSFRLQAQFGPKTDTAKFLVEMKPAALADLGTLPSGRMSYTALRLDAKASKALSRLLSEMSFDDENEDAKKALEAAAELLAEAGLEAQYSTSDLPLAGLEIAHFKDPAKAVSANLKILKALTPSSAAQNVPLKEKPEIKENAETVGDFKLHSAKLSLDIEKAVAEAPEQMRDAMKASLERMLGGEMRMWFGTDGKVFLNVTAKDWKTAKGLIDSYLKGDQPVSKDDSFQLTRKNLPSETTMVALVDTGRLVYELFEMFKEMFQAFPGGFPGGAMPELRKPTGKPAYLGVALTLKPEYGSFELFVPTTAAQQVRKLLAPLLEKDD
jgi:hypothetical protein